MIDQLRAMLKRGGTLTLEQIAHELDTTPEMIVQLLDHLERNGLLRQISRDCQATCDGCYLAQACARSAGQRIWSSVN